MGTAKRIGGHDTIDRRDGLRASIASPLLYRIQVLPVGVPVLVIFRMVGAAQGVGGIDVIISIGDWRLCVYNYHQFMNPTLYNIVC